MSKDEVTMFKKYLHISHNYFEYGCGGSTILANSYDNIQKIVSVDSCQNWIDKTKIKVNSQKVTFVHIDINANCDNWGKPKDESLVDNWINYPKAILSYHNYFSLVLVDGRFRRACCAAAAIRMNKDSFLLLHDCERYSNIPLSKIDQVDKLSVFVIKNLSDVELLNFVDLYKKDYQ